MSDEQKAQSTNQIRSVAHTEVFVGIGSNLGRRIHYLASAVHALGDLAAANEVVCSPVYETDPVGYLNQGSFLNMVATFKVYQSAQHILEKLLDIESHHGRVRTITNGPRTLDLDLLLFGDQRIADDRLSVPHPRMTERAFVLCPLADLAPHRCLDDGQTVQKLAQERAREGGIRYVGRFW